MPMQKIQEIEDRVKHLESEAHAEVVALAERVDKLETYSRTNDSAILALTDRVDAIAVSLNRIVEVFSRVESAVKRFLRFSRRVLIWLLGILALALATVLASYLAHFIP